MTRIYSIVIISLCFSLSSVQSFGSTYISCVGTGRSSSIRDGIQLFSFKPKNLQSNKFKIEHISSTKSNTLDEPSIAEMLRQRIELETVLDGSRNQFATTEPSEKSTEKTQSSVIPFLSPLWQARILLLLSASLYGTNFTFVKILNENVPECVGTSLRFALASLATLPWLLRRNQNEDDSVAQYVEPTLPFEGSNPIIGGFEVGMWNSIGYLAQAVGLETTPASTSAFLCSLAVVTVPILDYLAGRKLQVRQVIGACLAVIGVACLELDGLDGLVLSKNDLLSLVQPVVFGMGFWRMEHYMRKFPKHAKTLTAAQLSAIFLSSLSSFFLTRGGDIPDASQFMSWLANPIVLQSIAWTGLITTALTVYMETIALKTLSAAETTILFSTEPIFGSVCASVVLGETFGATGYVGGAMILSGCLYSNMGSNLVSLLPAKSAKTN
jgi:drug/metabolite transporter (DMT)-like permease